MKRKILATAITLTAAFTTSAVVAGGLPTKIGNSDAYVTTDAGDVVRDGSGHCVRTISWTPATAIPHCEGKMRVAAKPKASKPTVAIVEKPRARAKAADPEFVTVSMQAGALFDVNKATLKARGKEKLNLVAEKLKETITTETVQIAGHTDSTGSDKYNQRLSERRAAAVKAYLVTRGVPSNKINTIGFGESKPIANNNTRDGRARNRRVEVRIRATKQIR